MFLQVRNSGNWDRYCGSQSPVYPYIASNFEELRMEVCRPTLSL